MTWTTWIMPVLALVVGVISLYVDPKDPRKRTLFYALLPALVLTCAFQIYLSKQDNAKHDSDQKDLNHELSDIKAACDARNRTIVELADYGWSSARIANLVKQSPHAKPQDLSTQAPVRQSVQADAALKPLKPQAEQVLASRRAVTVRYYPKDVDREKVEDALDQLGFRTEIGPTQLASVPTNAIWFGDQVGLDDVKSVAYVLIRAGVQVKSIRRFANSSGSKALLIEVGSDATLVGRPALTVDEIQRATDFPR